MFYQSDIILILLVLYNINDDVNISSCLTFCSSRRRKQTRDQLDVSSDRTSTMLSQHIHHECAPAAGGGAGAASRRCLFSGQGAGRPKPLMKKASMVSSANNQNANM